MYDLKATAEKMQKSKKCFLVIGDVMLDEYIFCDVERISPEAPVPVARVKGKKYMLGGCGNVLENIHSLNGKTFILTVVGSDKAGVKLYEMLEPLVADKYFLLSENRRITTIKKRIIAHSQQVLRIDEEVNYTLGPQKEQEVINKLKKYIDKVDVVVVSDYNKGVLTNNVLSSTISFCTEKGIPVIIDPKREDYKNYKGATLITPNEKEALQACGETWSTATACTRLSEDFNIKQVLITRGEGGMTFFDGEEIHHLLTDAEHVYDVTGAGDTVTAVMALGLACKVNMRQCAQIANTAAGIVVGEIGTVSPTWDKILRRLE